LHVDFLFAAIAARAGWAAAGKHPRASLLRVTVGEQTHHGAIASVTLQVQNLR
jgi:hypothetical protein